jgi:type IV pilus assembly protein PilB
MSFLGELANAGIISSDDIPKIESEASESGSPVENILIQHGVSEGDILHAKGAALQLPFVELGEKQIPFEILKYIPEESAAHYGFVPLDVKDDILEVGLVDPDNVEARDALNFISSKINMPFKIFLIKQSDFDRVLQTYKGLSGEVTQALTDLESEMTDDQKDLQQSLKATTEAAQKNGDTNIVEDAPVTKIVATILRFALDGNASDIHIEPMRDKVRVRFRIDGVLNTSLVLPTNILQAVVARIKILSDMKLDEKRKPQDGRFSARIEGRKIDFRVSTFPSYYGEKVVMRILDQERGVKKLDEIGFSPKNMVLIREAITRPYGMILITGPTGSGKSSTLYSMLNEVDKEKVNVLSLEDPVEYNMEGVTQSQVRPEIGYTFATGLRTTLRQDPDVIMVGEIRDKETAQLAVQAALTGHLVLSTLHTNTAIGAIPRLVDMGIDPYLIAPTLILTMAQRLVSKICPGGGKLVPVEGALKVMIDREFQDLPPEFRKEIPEVTEVLEAEPTDDCPKGVRGRQAVCEVFKMDKDLEKMILKDPTEAALWPILRSKGMLTIKEDAMIKAFNHEIPFEEVNKL